jgi:hypothetical protein
MEGISVAVAEMASDKPFRLSWTRLKELEECRAKGWLHHQGKFAETRDNRIFFPGTVVDRCMRSWLDADEQVPGAMIASVDEIMDREEASAPANGDGTVRWKSASDRDRTREKCRECCRRLEPILAERVVPHSYQAAVRFAVEVSVPYRGEQRSLTLTGELDLLVIEHAGPDLLKIYDLKMTENDSYWQQTYPQLIFYEIACFGQRLGWAAQSYLIQPLCKEPVLAFTFTMEHRMEMWGRIVTAAEYWWNGDHRPKEGNEGCGWCPAKHACPKLITQGKRRLMGAAPVTLA